MARIQQNQQAPHIRPPAPSIAAQSAQLAAANPGRSKKRAFNLSDEEEESSEGSVGEDFGEDVGQAEKEANGLEFFNTCGENELPDITGASV